MRVAILADTHAGGASGPSDAECLAAALARRDHDVRLITASPTAAERDATQGYRVVTIPVTDADPDPDTGLMPMIGEMGRFLVDEYTGEPADVVHCQGWAYGMAAALAANRRPVPTVQAFPRVSDGGPGGKSATAATPATATKIETLLARNATMITAACTDDVTRIVRLGAPRARVTVLPSGIDVDAYATPPAERGTARHRIVALVDDLTAPRGVDHLIAALPAVPSAELLVLGSGTPDCAAVQQLRAHARHVGVGERTRVMAAVDDMDAAAWVGSADVAVCPSPYDSDARWALMAMACGVAVVAIEAGGPRDAVIADVTGLLVPPGHPEALSRALRSVLAQNVLRQGMGLAGRARARSRYSWERVAVDAETVFQTAARQATVSA